jgi:hypothetical protein
MKLEDKHRGLEIPLDDIDAEVEIVFQKHYLDTLSGSPPFIRLESEYFCEPTCTVLISVLQECTGLANTVVI